MMAALLAKFLEGTGQPTAFESAGILSNSSDHQPAGGFAVTTAARIGIDLTGHRTRDIAEVRDLREFDLVVCVSDEIAGKVIGLGVSPRKIFKVNITNPFPCNFQETYDQSFREMLVATYDIIAHYFS